MLLFVCFTVKTAVRFCFAIVLVLTVVAEVGLLTVAAGPREAPVAGAFVPVALQMKENKVYLPNYLGKYFSNMHEMCFCILTVALKIKMNLCTI